MIRSIDYKFNCVINCLTEIETDNIKGLLPKNLYPFEVHPDLSLLSIIGFDFYDTPVGKYQEIIIGILTQAYLTPEKNIPKATIFPINLATTSDASRQHAIDNYKLPHYLKNIDISFDTKGPKKILKCKEDNKIFLNIELVIENKGEKAKEYHQSLIYSAEKIFLSKIYIDANICETQDEKGNIELTNHDFFKNININSINNTPYLERFASTGVETMFELESIQF